MISRLSKKCLASENLFFQLIGALFKRLWLVMLLLIVVLSPLYSCQVSVENQWYQFPVSIIVLLLVWSVCNIMTEIFNLRRKEAGITWCQIAMLIAFGCWIIGVVLIFDITDKNINAAAFGIAGSLLAWIFQDSIRGVVAFILLRFNHLLQIDDWIKVPNYNVNGKVVRVTLTNVTVYNWDTTTSTIPTSALLSGHFINMQKMAEGKTYGRRMDLSFIMDTSSFYSLSQTDADNLKANNCVTMFLPGDEIRESMTNAQLFRQYLFHWLMKNPHISQQPTLIVRWQNHTENGMIIQMLAFIKDTNMSAFEWQQSLIVEHVIQSLKWFGLRLYQSPSSYDSKSSTIYISENPLTE